MESFQEKLLERFYQFLVLLMEENQGPLYFYLGEHIKEPFSCERLDLVHNQKGVPGTFQEEGELGGDLGCQTIEFELW